METHKALETDSPETYFDEINECGALNQICSLNSIDTNSLSRAGKEETDTAFRWACLVSSSPLVEDINNSFNAPKEFKEISIICNQIIAFKGESSITAEDIIELADKTDIYRKEERFLKAEQASTFCDGNSKTELNWGSLVQCINDIKASTNLQEGKLIAKKLKKDRLEAVELYLSNS